MSSKPKPPTKDEDKPALVPKLRFPEFRNTGIWRKTTVGRISNTVIAGGTPSTSEKNFWGGDLRWMNSGELNYKKVYEVQGRITGSGLSNSSTKLIPPRCVLIGLAGQGKTRGTVAMNMVELCTNQSIAAIFPNDSAFNSDFLYHDLDMRYDELRRLSAGGEGRGGLNLQIIKSLVVILPSLPEQQKIADCLTSVDELIAAQARKVDALRIHKKGLMQQLFPREGETQPRLRFPEFQDAGDWAVKPFSELCDIKHGYAFEGEFFSNEGDYVLLTPGNFYEEGGYRDRGEKQKYYTGEIPRDYVLNFGDLVVAMTEQAAGLLGSPILVPESGKFLHNQRLGLVTTRLGVPWTNEFFFHVFNTQPVRKAIHASASGTKVRHTSPTKIGDIGVSFPTLLPEQQRIADCFTTLDELISTETQRLEALKTHKKGLMQQLFPAPEEVEA